MHVGFCCSPRNPDLAQRMAEASDRYDFDTIGIAKRRVMRWSRGLWRRQLRIERR
jgi:hypothetical protein